MAGENEEGGHKPLTEEQARELLDRLSSDDAFRARFSSDPATALREVGYSADAGASLACMQASSLASKDQIAASRDMLADQMTSNAAHTNPHCFEASGGPTLS